ncbi:hypothetical protein P167DRAFT_571779 [Morchella conica CCBAS932]|uniref:Uncharacterized protein n=1 Tax=Morchella conica CCBAS932 TaxID=1392247 RepID=A0A3N4KXM2_9PEZI|nr:hypothetical protein P167DRAFT_571779 [Morchella conica CCBAS932]
MALDYGNAAHLLPTTYKKTVADWLTEDTPSFDYGGFVVGEDEKTATLYGKSAGVLAGVPFFDEVFAQLGCTYGFSPPLIIIHVRVYEYYTCKS